jgi:hypothetical protein
VDDMGFSKKIRPIQEVEVTIGQSRITVQIKRGEAVFTESLLSRRGEGMCECDRCKQYKQLEAIAAKLNEEDADFLIGLHGKLDTVEMELHIRDAVIDGSWRGADDWIANARST